MEDYLQEVTIPFNNLLKLLQGETPEGSIDIAGWFFTDAYNFEEFGVIDPGKTAVSSVNLEPVQGFYKNLDQICNLWRIP